INAFRGVGGNPRLFKPAAFTGMTDIDPGAGLDDETRCHGTALPWHSRSVRFCVESVGYGPFEAGSCLGRPAQLTGKDRNEVSRSRAVGGVVDVTDIVADGRRVIPCTGCRCTRRIVTPLAYDLVAVERAGNDGGLRTAFHDALPVVRVIAGRRFRRIGGRGANAERPCKGS